MSKKICKKLKEGERISRPEKPKYVCKACEAAAHTEKELCKPKRTK